MRKANQDIKKAAAAARVYLYEIAERLGISDSAFSRKLRCELSQVEKAKIYSIIENLNVEVAGDEQ